MSQSYPLLVYIALACSAAIASFSQHHKLPNTDEGAPAALSFYFEETPEAETVP